MELDFAWALERMSKEVSVMRACWPRHTWVSGQLPKRLSRMSVPYLFMNSPQGMFPWAPSNLDLFAKDWKPFTEEGAMFG